MTTFMSNRDNLCVRKDNLYVKNQHTPPNAKFPHFERVPFDELAAQFDLVGNADSRKSRGISFHLVGWLGNSLRTQRALNRSC